MSPELRELKASIDAEFSLMDERLARAEEEIRALKGERPWADRLRDYLRCAPEWKLDAASTPGMTARHNGQD